MASNTGQSPEPAPKKDQPTFTLTSTMPIYATEVAIGFNSWHNGLASNFLEDYEKLKQDLLEKEAEIKELYSKFSESRTSRNGSIPRFDSKSH